MERKAMILVVEDDKRMLAAEARILKSAGHDVLTAETLAAAREHMKNTMPDAVVLDILLPDGNGLDFISEIREITAAPVLLATSLGARDERLAGLKAGGDDYIAKPFDVEEMAERVNAFLRREAMHRENPPRELAKGSLTLDTVAVRAYLSGEDMQLTQKEFALLLLLAQNEGKTLTKEYLYETVWKQPMAGDDRTVKKHLSSVRNKLAGSGYSIAVSRGEGYCFEKT